MHVSWFKNEEHLVYINGETELPALEKALKFPGLTAAAAQLRDQMLALKGEKVMASGEKSRKTRRKRMKH